MAPLLNLFPPPPEPTIVHPGIPFFKIIICKNYFKIQSFRCGDDDITIDSNDESEWKKPPKIFSSTTDVLRSTFTIPFKDREKPAGMLD